MMKAYKRLLAFFMAVAVFSSASLVSVSAAETDTESGSKTVTAIQESIPAEIRAMMTVLKSFEIIPDYYDYNLPLDYEVPRADFAASVARMMGKTTYSGSEVYFYDVPRNYWAFHEISNLTEMGILNGTGDKLFRPGDTITKDAAYKIILCAMGYRNYVENYEGGYPIGYATVANRIGLTKGVTSGQTLTMKDMLHILYNALTVNIMETTGYTNDSAMYEMSDDETLISLYRGIYYGKGTVNGANSITVNGGKLADNIALIDDEEYNSNSFNMIDYLGEKIEFFYKIDEVSDEKTLVWVNSKSSDIKTISIDGDATLDTDSFVFTYYNENGKRSRITLDRSVLLVYNGGIVESGYDEILNNHRYELKLVYNGSKCTVMIVRAYENYIVGTINSQDSLIYDKQRTQTSLDLDAENYDTFCIKRMGKEDMSFEDIKKDDVLTVYESKDNKHMEVYVSSNTVSGTIETIGLTENHQMITIGGKQYRVDENRLADDYSVGDDVTAYTNLYDEIVYITASSGGFQGAFLLQAEYEGSRLKDTLSVKFLGEDSKVTSLKCAEKVTIDGITYKNLKEAYKALLAGENKLTAQFALIRKNADGEIREIDTTTLNEGYETSNSLQIDVPFWYGTETTYTQRLVRANSNAARIGEKIVFDENTKVFVVPNVSDYDTVSEDDLWVTVGSKLVSDTGTFAQSYKTAEDIGITKYLLLKEYNPSKVNVELPILVQGISSGIDENGDAIEVLDGYQGAAPVHIAADESVSDLYSKNRVLPGDVVTIQKDSYGNVKGCTVIYDYRTSDHRAITALNDALGMFVGYANSVVDNVVKIGYESGAECDFAVNAMANPVLLFDTSDGRNRISKATTGDIITYKNDPDNCSTVFIVTKRMQPQMFIIYK